MGSSASQEDKKPLLRQDEEIEPIFEELKLVLIGSQGAGKNTIANAILKEKVFTFWTRTKSVHVKETRTVSGTRIHLARTPGWRGDLNRSEQTKCEIVHCVQSLYSSGPHAVILVLKVNSVLSESNISALESLLTVQLWEHTIVVFTSGEKLGGYTIEDYIRCQQLQTLIEKCGERYFVIRNNDSNQITETIETLIVMKNSTSCFVLTPQTEDNNALLSDLKELVKRIKSKINSIITYKKKLQKEQNENLMKKLLDSKDAEIRKLEKIVKEKEREIERLQSGCSRTQGLDPSALLKRIAELEKMLKEKDAKIDDLQKALDWRTNEDQYRIVHARCQNELGQDVSAMATRNPIQIQLQVFSSKGSAPHNWGHTLLKILEMLTRDELKKMKFYMCNDEDSIHMGSLEDKDRVDLAHLMLTQWGKRQSVLKTRDLIKKIPRKDMIQLFEPFLTSGETW